MRVTRILTWLPAAILLASCGQGGVDTPFVALAPGDGAALEARPQPARPPPGCPTSGTCDAERLGRRPTLAEFGDCASLEACLERLDRMAPSVDLAQNREDEYGFSELFQRFGEPAKAELLARTAGPNPGLRGWAAAILQFWPDWSPQDIAALRAGLRLNPDSGLAAPLGGIGTPEAAAVLIENLGRERVNRIQTVSGLMTIGHRVLPGLTLLLAREPERGAARDLVTTMHDIARAQAGPWARQALDRRASRALRIGALRGLAAMGENARPVAESLKPLRFSLDAGIRREARKTIAAIEA